jgi:hypothetical protein
MRTKLIIILLIIGFASFADNELKTTEIILSAPTEVQIKKWADDKGTSSRILKFKGDGKDVIVLLVDTASGTTRENLYVYYMEANIWYLCLFRVTNGQVYTENSGKTLVFRNKKGEVLAEQPFVSMRHIAD